MQYVVAGLEDQVVAVVELVHVDRHARDRRHDRRADRAVGDHAVALPAALGRDRHDGGGQVAQQLIDLVGLQDWHGTIFTAASERRARQSPQPPRQSFILQHDVAAVAPPHPSRTYPPPGGARGRAGGYVREDRKSTRLNSSHLGISYAVFCLKKKKKTVRLEPKLKTYTMIL